MKIMNVKFAESILEDLKRLLLKMWKWQKRLANIIEILNKSHWTVKVKKKKEKKNWSWEFGWERRLLGCSGTLTWKNVNLSELWFRVLKNGKRRSADRLACLTLKICYALTDRKCWSESLDQSKSASLKNNWNTYKALHIKQKVSSVIFC